MRVGCEILHPGCLPTHGEFTQLSINLFFLIYIYALLIFEIILPWFRRSVFAARAANDPRDEQNVEHRAHEGGGH